MTLINFNLDSKKEIQISIPNIPDKFNYYYEPTEKMHRFDEATVNFITPLNQIEIKKDILGDIFVPFYKILKRAIHKTVVLPNEIQPGRAGYMLNLMLNDLNKIDLGPFWVWSSLTGNDTLIYNASDIIYLEIVPAYPWTFKDPDPGEEYISLDTFLEKYKPLVFEKIPYKVALEWLNKSEGFLRLLEYDDEVARDIKKA